MVGVMMGGLGSMLGLREREVWWKRGGMADRPDKIALQLGRFWKALWLHCQLVS